MEAGCSWLSFSFPFDSEQKSAPFVLLDQGYNFPKRYETSLLGSPMSGVQHAHTGDGCRHLRRSEPNARPWGRVTKNVPGSLWCVPTNSHVQTCGSGLVYLRVPRPLPRSALPRTDPLVIFYSGHTPFPGPNATKANEACECGLACSFQPQGLLFCHTSQSFR